MSKKKDSILRTFKPGKPIQITCVGTCGGKVTFVPEDENQLLGKLEFACVKCGGIVTKFTMPREKAEDVNEVDKQQRRLD